MIAILVVMFNCALHERMIPALEMISTVNILPQFAKCPILRVSVLAKFVLSFMDFALADPNVLILSQQEISYISSQLTEAVIEGSSKDWYTDLELLKVLTNLTHSPHFSINAIQMKNSVFPIVSQFLQSSNLDVQKAALRLLLNFCSCCVFPSISSTLESAVSEFATSDDLNFQQLTSCMQLLLDANLQDSKFPVHF